MSRSRVQGFEKSRLNQVLAARCLSKVQLASMVGTSPSSITKWSSGDQVPELKTLEKLAEVVNILPEWFTRPMLEKLPTPLFRSMASAHATARNMLEARLAWAQEIAVAFMEFVDYPDLNLPIRNFNCLEEITNEDIEKAASECRDRWRLGRVAIQNLALASEGAGVILIREETGIAQIEGLSSWSNILDRPLVLLSADKDNGYRSRFDLAHEIGHLVLHRHIKQTIDQSRHKLMEKQASKFAGALLLPPEMFESELNSSYLTLEDLLLLKSRWGVSVNAIIMRLKALDILSEETTTNLFKSISARWGRKKEPNDGDRTPEQPHLLQRTIDLLVEENLMPLSAISQYIGLAPIDIEMLAGLPTGYLSGKTNIIQFAGLRTTQAHTREPKKQCEAVVLPFSKTLE
jgi:Zn-dependent peptidase ImmA (M78 family)/DNA-binding XRE family transcriptional regulator